MSDVDWRAEAEKAQRVSQVWERRTREAQSTIRRMKRELDEYKDSGRAWRTAYHSLRLTLEGRLDRIAEAVESKSINNEGENQ